jgi:putative aldouronate transport system substrate-binding protein
MFKLEYPPRNAKSITATTGEAIDYHCWSSYQALPSDPVTEQWREDYGAANIFEWAKNNGTLINSCNESYSGLAGLTNPDPDLELMINQIGDVVKQYSWKMAYAESEAEFDRLYDEMMTKVKGFGYDEVMEYYRAETEKLYKTRAELSKSIQ